MPEDSLFWQTHWRALNQPWRTEPEISPERQQVLAEHLALPPDIERGIYPFKDLAPPLTRADIEWLLAAHEGGKGPVDWQIEPQRTRVGLDLRGVTLRAVDLTRLPLARLHGGLTEQEWNQATPQQRKQARIQLDNIRLDQTHLEGAYLRGALLYGVLHQTHLEQADLAESGLGFSALTEAHLEGANLTHANLEDAIVDAAYLEGARLTKANCFGAYFKNARLQEVDLQEARLELARLAHAHLEGGNLRGANLNGADLRGVMFSEQTHLDGVSLTDTEVIITRTGPYLAEVSWGGVDLTQIDWASIDLLADEAWAEQRHGLAGVEKTAAIRLADYQAAERAYRQLASALEEQRLTDVAARFLSRAHHMAEQAAIWQAKVE